MQNRLWQRIGCELSGNPFNARVPLKNEQGKPRNPFINAGAIAVADRLLPHGNGVGTLPELLSSLCSDSVHLDPEIAQSEADTGFRSHAVANFMKGFGKLDNPVVAGEFAQRIGLPCKSGIVAVVPDQLTLCVLSPALDASGNLLLGMHALELFAARTGLSIF